MKVAAQGLTLFEMLLAMVLSLCVLTVVFGLYVAAQQSTRLQAELSRAQDNASTAISLLTDEIRQAGRIGCPRLSRDFPLHSHVPISVTVADRLYSHDDNQGLVVKHVTYPVATLLVAMPDKHTLVLDQYAYFHVGDVVLISDCVHADIATIASVYKQAGKQVVTTKQALSFHYAAYAECGHFKIYRYFVEKTKRKKWDGSSVYALYRQDAKRTMELVEGVKAIHWMFSVQQLGQIIELPAERVQDWASVLGVGFDLIMDTRLFPESVHAYVMLS